MKPELLEEILSRADVCTEGPWEHRWGGTLGRTVVRAGKGGQGATIEVRRHGPYGNVPPEGYFIAAARTDVPALVAEIRRLRTALEGISRADVRRYGSGGAGILARAAATALCVTHEWVEEGGFSRCRSCGALDLKGAAQ